ncbi:MAG: purine-cytosine permease family protein, partial [Acidimicrobiales bacterium]
TRGCHMAARPPAEPTSPARRRLSRALLADGGPSRTNDLTLERRGIRPVPPAHRYGSTKRLMTLWFGAQINPTTMFVGALGTASFIGLGWKWGIVAIVIGNLIGSITVAMLGVIGVRTGSPQLQQSREAFGRTVHFPAALTWITQIGFEALESIFAAEALKVLTGMSFYLGLAITFACMGVVSIIGYEAIHLFQKVMAGILLALFVAITVKTFLGSPHVVQHLPGGSFEGGFVLMVAVVLSYAISWGVCPSDYSRYLPKDSSALGTFNAIFFPMVVGMIWIEILGFAASSLLMGLSTMAGVNRIMGGGGLGDVAMVAMFLGTVSIMMVSDYSGALAAQALGVPIIRPVATAISAVCAFGVAAWLNTGSTGSKFEDVLLLISYWIAPWSAVVLIDWARRTRRLQWRQHSTILESAYSGLRAGWREWSAVAAIVAGFLVSMPFSDTTTGYDIATAHPALKWFFGGFANHFMGGGTTAFYVGFVVGTAVYLGLLAMGRSDAQSDLPLKIAAEPALQTAGVE